MPYKDLEHFARTLEERGLLTRVSTAVDPELELTEIADRVMKRGGPALLFENVVGSPYPVLINAFGSSQRMRLALEVDDLDEIGERIRGLLELTGLRTLTDKIRALPVLHELSGIFPRLVRSGACQEVVEKSPDLTTLPVLKCWPQDGGPFFTLPLVITKDPESGRHNVGMYRMQLFDGRTTGMHWHPHKDGAHHYQEYCRRGERMPVAVALGADPALVYAATAPLPAMVSEYLFAGFLRRKSVDLVRAKTVDLEVPADAEFVLEGYVEPGELRREGPFGDHTGYYSLADMYPVFHVECVTRKRRPIYPATIVGKPPMEDCYLGKATERIFLPLLRLQVPEIVDLNLPLEGVFHNCAIVSIKKTYPGQTRKVMHSLWGLGQMMYTKLIIVVDHNIDAHDMSTVLWKVFNNIDARRDVVICEGPLDALDHASPTPLFGAKMGIDATKKGPADGHLREWPDDIEMTPAVKELVDRRWQEYGLR